MADLSITAAQVLRVSGGVKTLLAGEAITAGQVVYLKAADGKFWLADANGTGTTTVKGIALNSAAAGQPVTAILTGGVVTLGAVAAPTKGVLYVLSNTPGGIQAAPPASGGTAVYLGVGNAANGLNLSIVNTGVAVA